MVANPLRLSILWVGLVLARFGLVTEERARRTTELAWPRIVTGIARMSKNAVDVAMVGVAVGGAAIAGGTIALVSQRYGAEAYEELGLAVRASTLLVVVASIPIVAAFWLFPEWFVSLVSSDPAVIDHGAAYLRVVALGIPFAGLNLVGSRVLAGADDAAWPLRSVSGVRRRDVRAGGAELLPVHDRQVESGESRLPSRDGNGRLIRT